MQRCSDGSAQNVDWNAYSWRLERVLRLPLRGWQQIKQVDAFAIVPDHAFQMLPCCWCRFYIRFLRLSVRTPGICRRCTAIWVGRSEAVALPGPWRRSEARCHGDVTDIFNSVSPEPKFQFLTSRRNSGYTGRACSKLCVLLSSLLITVCALTHEVRNLISPAPFQR